MRAPHKLPTRTHTRQRGRYLYLSTVLQKLFQLQYVVYRYNCIDRNTSDRRVGSTKAPLPTDIPDAALCCL